jgi:hypothetical protein
MSDMNTTPELTLTPDTAAAVAMPEAPALTLTPDLSTETAAAEKTADEQKKRDENAVKLDESMLSEAERKMV